MWFGSILVPVRHVPFAHIKQGMEESDKVTELSKALQRMNRWNFWAAGLMGVTALLAALARYLG